MTELDKLQAAWQEMAETDPMWFIVSRDGKRDSWAAEEFFTLGAKDAAELLETLSAIGLPRQRGRLLDFGCGIGRLTMALAPHFEEVTGLDISPGMIQRAQKFSEGLSAVSFNVNETSDLTGYPDQHFDVVYCNGVLQHQPSAELQIGYIEEFVRVLKPGGLLYLQLPAFRTRRSWLLARRRPYRLLRHAGVPASTLHKHLHLHEMEMTPLPESRVIDCVNHVGGRCVRVDRPGRNRVYYVTRV